MNKKLFVVLFVVAAMLVTVSWAIAAKKASTPVDVTEYTPKAPLYPGGGERMVIDKTIPAEKLDIKILGADQAQWQMAPGGAPELLQDPKQDTCLVTMHSGAAYWWRGFFGPDEIIKEYQDPETSVPPCPMPVYPFAITKLYWHFQDTTSAAFAVVGYFDVEIADLSDPNCPKPGQVIYQSPALQWNIPYGGHWRLTYFPEHAVCVNGPYFVSFYLYYQDPWYEIGPIIDATADICRSYDNYGTGWYDIVVDYGSPGNFLLYSAGFSYADGYNICPQKPECEYYLWHDGSPWYSYLGYDAGAVWYQSPKTGYIGRARIAFDYFTASPDAWFFLWDGDPVNGPQNKIDSIFVPNSDLVAYPNWVEVDFTLDNVTVDVGDYVFFGYEPVRPNGWPIDTLSWLSDYNGNGVETHSWLKASGVWWDEYSAWGDYAEYMMELEICGEEPCAPESVVTLLDYGAPTWIFAYPSTSGRNYINQRFSLPVYHGGRLDQIKLAFYNKKGTPSPNVYVWLDDGNGLPLDANPPSNAMMTYNIPAAQVVVFPTYQVVQTWEDGIYFDPGEEFHIGYSIDLSQTGDTLSHVYDDYTDENAPFSDRVSAWWPGDYWENWYDHYGLNINMIMSAVMCATAPPESTFALTALPTTGYISPGDADHNVFDVTVIPIVGYALNVDLDIDPASVPAGITYYYDPASGTPEFASDLYLSCGGAVPYGSYTLKLRGTGADAQVRTKDVTLIVQPPYDEVMVPFYGEGKDQNAQRATNFGAVGNDAADNFLWYGLSTLFDGSFAIATTDPDHMALDIYNCHYWGWVPQGHIVLYDMPEYDAHVAFGEFCCDEEISGVPGVPGECDSVFIVGIEKCDTVIIGDPPDTILMPADFSIKIKIFYTEGAPIEDMYISLFEDWDVGTVTYASYNNWVDMDPDHNLIWQYGVQEVDQVFGMMKAPFYDDPMYNMVAVRNPEYVWPNEGFCDDAGGFWGLDSLYWLMTTAGVVPPTPPDTDFSLMMTAGPVTIAPGNPHIEIWIDFGRDLTDGFSWAQWYHRVLRYAGFYRGDVNASDFLEVPSLDVSDLVYLINYLFKQGPAPHPYADQGDLNANGIVNMEDIVYMINYVFKGGPPPKDCVRFIPGKWCRTSLFESPNW